MSLFFSLPTPHLSNRNDSTGRGRFLYDQLGPSIIYSEQTNEELEALFRTIIDDDEFLDVCQEKFDKVDLSSNLPREKFDYDEISATNKDQLKGRVVHEINMSVYYNVEVDRNNSDVTYVHRTINVIPDEKTDRSSKQNRFSNLKLPNDIDRYVQMHDYVHHSQMEKKPSIKRRTTHVEPKRRTTIAAINETEEYDAAFLAQVVEQQLQAARRAEQAKKFTPIVNQPTLVPPTPVNRAKFVRPPTLPSRIDHIEYPKTNLNHLPRRPLTFIDNLVSQPMPWKDERDKLIMFGQQGIRSTATAFGSPTIPNHIQTIELLEIPRRKSHNNQSQDFHLISYETVEDHLLPYAPDPPPLRRAKSMRQINKQTESSTSRRASAIVSGTGLEKPTHFTSPLKSIKRHLRHKNETANHNKPVSREKSKGNCIVDDPISGENGR